MVWDFSTFYYAAECWMQGQSPYACAHFFYPLPTLFLFLPLTAFPLPVAKIIWMLLLLTSLVVVCKRRTVWYVLYVPALQALYLGQIDLVLLPAILLANGPAMALVTLKPQLVWIYLPIWLLSVNWVERKRFLIVAGALWGASFLAWPMWVPEFLATTRGLGQAAYASPSLWGGNFLPWWLVIILGIILIRYAKNRWAATMAVNPAVISYDLIVLLPRARWWLVPLSWITQWSANQIGAAWPHAALSVAIALAGKRHGEYKSAAFHWNGLPAVIGKLTGNRSKRSLH
jgi:hypothetical protein